jgi:Tfp pilus assembly protein PilX
MTMKHLCSASRQRGAVLMIGMVMLLMIMLIAVGLVRMSTRHTQIVNNEQVRAEAAAAANFALDQVLNQSYVDGNWTQYAGAGQAVNVNIGLTQMADSADGTTGTVAVTVSKLTSKRCRKVSTQEILQTIAAQPQNKACIYTPGNPPLSIGGTAAGSTSLCSDVLYEVEARANDPQLLSTSEPVTQGVEVLIGDDCP